MNQNPNSELSFCSINSNKNSPKNQNQNINQIIQINLIDQV
jgi:hypothetical protein